MRRDRWDDHKECYCSLVGRETICQSPTERPYSTSRHVTNVPASDAYIHVMPETSSAWNITLSYNCFKHLTWLEADECKSAPRTFFLLSNSHKNSLLLSLGYEPVPQKKHTSDENIYILSFAYTHQQSHLSLSLVSSTSRLDTASLLWDILL